MHSEGNKSFIFAPKGVMRKCSLLYIFPFLSLFAIVMLALSCSGGKKEKIVTPWGKWGRTAFLKT